MEPHALRRALLRVPLFYKILIANAIIVVLGAVIGTAVTLHYVRSGGPPALVLGGALALGLGVFIARGIVRSLNRVRSVCEGLAAGDLTRTTGLESEDEPGRMGRALDEALGRLYKTPEQFGLCEVDGEPIEFDRLMVIPETRLCARHAREAVAAAGVDANPREADGRANQA